MANEDVNCRYSDSEYEEAARKFLGTLFSSGTLCTLGDIRNTRKPILAVNNFFLSFSCFCNNNVIITFTDLL